MKIIPAMAPADPRRVIEPYRRLREMAIPAQKTKAHLHGRGAPCFASVILARQRPTFCRPAFHAALRAAAEAFRAASKFGGFHDPSWRRPLMKNVGVP